MENVLTVNRLTMNFGGLQALDAVDLEVRQGEIAALIGPNGAGKTTFFNCITGIYEPTAGDIFILPPGGRRQRINGLKINHVTELGMARTFQNIRWGRKKRSISMWTTFTGRERPFSLNLMKK